MSSHAIAPIALLTRYFNDPEAIPVVNSEFYPGRGWLRAGFDKRISSAWARKLQAEGATQVRLTFAGRSADFSLEEILRSR